MFLNGQFIIIIKVFNGRKNHAFTNKGAYNNVNFTSKNGSINDSNIFFLFSYSYANILIHVCFFLVKAMWVKYK